MNFITFDAPIFFNMELEVPRGTKKIASSFLPVIRKLYIESYGCQMNFSDSEIVASILSKEFTITKAFHEADVILINTCAIRDGAEQRIRNRLKEFNIVKAVNPALVVGVLGCMAERLKAKLLDEERLVDLVLGPDAYRDLPRLIAQADEGQRSVNVLLSREETYADLAPVRFSSNGVSAFVSIMRGCDNMCSFCVVPFTRGRERSRELPSILNEIKQLAGSGYKEITLLGQNVDSYRYQEGEATVSFAALLEHAAKAAGGMRVRFSTSHPKDITQDVLRVMASAPSVCNYIHLPAQSGSSAVLSRMNRTYDRAGYLEKIKAVRDTIPECAISTDIITGFCGETEQDHNETLSLMEAVKFDYAYMFKYSERPGTPAAKKFVDDVSEEVKSRRLNEIIELQHRHSHERLLKKIGSVQEVLVEGRSKKSADDLCGRADDNAMVVFRAALGIKKGDMARVLVERCTSATLIGSLVI